MKETTLADCQAMDRGDSLAQFRSEFVIPEGMVYLDGNSLGVLPRAARDRALQVIDHEWGESLVNSWNEAGWWELPLRLGDKIGRLVGARPGEVAVTDSTGINMYKVMAAALTLVPERRVIVMEGSNFPTNNYMAQGLVAQLGEGYRIRFAEAEQLVEAIDADVAAVCLTQVHYKSGRMLDMARLTRHIHAVGAVAIWDLCHSAGAMEVDLNACAVDFAIGCCYKYLNGGPGSPAFIFAASRHHGIARQPLSGWWGHADPFAFERDYRPADGIRQMLSGTQPIISMALVEPGLDLFLRTDMAAVRAKSLALTSLFIELVDQRCGDCGFALASPRDALRRGSQVSLRHEEGYAIIQALNASGVVGDFRAPDIMRFGFAPLYTGFVDVWRAVESLRQIMASSRWRRPEFSRRSVVT